MSRGNTEWLSGLGSLGIRLGLENITELLRTLGDPQDSFRSIHVAGTDGKGSTSAMIHSILKGSGFRTGLYTSPHILDVNERIRIHRPITDEELDLAAGDVRKAVSHMGGRGKECTYFEVLTAMAFLYFKEEKVDFAVVETGLGGRFDATNVIVPDVSVITHIGLEHTAVLGDTVEKIAFEKSGIIKKGVPVVTANKSPSLDVIRSAANEKGSQTVVVDTYKISDIGIHSNGTSLSYDGRNYNIGIPGRFQAENAAVAIETLRVLPERDIIEAHIQRGLNDVRWDGRMQRRGDLILDVSHTADGTEGLARDILEIYGKVILVMGMLDDKDADSISKNLSQVARKVFVTMPDSERAADAWKVAGSMSKYHSSVDVREDVGSAMESALSERKSGELILVTGSFHMVEDAERWLRRTYAGY